ncbi:XRE family transcriptional regulator [Pseudomonas extremaustralis]|uniref:helix-turn-helix domain-containing protein n=1 Tax=Pseudomonas extremaustralis TaxID=359110 RepID=UPI00240EB058|nr:XRE family transcriptional regulator [Pseudomonas extremaustralis]MDG2965640.1 XRE family transcriptional regulator [Pseudomonas extremaustralis]MDG2965652.1 XRE family transcriptional regulator [Pseudomonas extremaustralis]
MTEQESYASVWDAICDSPGEATVMKLKSKLLMGLQTYVKSCSGEEDAATFLAITKPRLAELLHGKIDRFTFEQLAHLAVAAGLDVDIQVEHRLAR